ncbi:MAG: hypothetical protein ACRC2U_01040 [Aeromonas sp.]
MPISDDKINSLRAERHQDHGGVLSLPPEAVTPEQFNSAAAAIRALDPLRYAAIQRSITLRFYQSQMIPKVDYGLVSGCGDKPILFKSGAEKLTTLFNLSTGVTLLKDHEDWDKGVFAYTYKAVVRDRLNRVLSECVGACNSKERKYLKQDAFSIQNTLHKMAQKRALVGAVLLATNASALFANGETELRQNLSVDGDRPTWDLDAEVVEAPEAPTPITAAQVKRLFAIAKEAGHTKESLYLMLEQSGIESIKAILPTEYDDVCDRAADKEMAAFFLGQVPSP